jgi:DNA-binding CsgD family transcriptional regulator
MDVILNPREQSALRHVLLADHDSRFLVSTDVAHSLTALIPCDLLQAAEGDAQGWVIRGLDHPHGVAPDIGPQVCDGPWSTGLEHFAQLPHDDPDRLASVSFGARDALRLQFATSRRTVVGVSFISRGREFTPRDLAILTMLEPALGRLLKAGTALGASAAVLTTRERRVLEHVASGMSNREAAEDLFVSEATIRKHLENAYRKLGVSSRTGALAAVARTS